jgi:hypothetical protein
MWNYVSSSNIMRVIKSIRMKYAGHVAYKCTDEVHTWCWQGDLMEGVHLEYLVVDGRIILKLNFNKWHGDRT